MPGDDETELASEKSARALMATYGAGNAERIERSLVYTFHARFAERFRIRRVFFAGDAAHVMPPFAGQGLNSGMRDAANLAWKLAGVLDGTFADSILDTYDPERRPHIEEMTELTIKLGRTIMPTNQIRAWFRDRLMLTAWRFPRTREKMNRGDMIPKPSISGTDLVNWARKSEVGAMIAQPTIVRDGSETKLDDLLGSGFGVIGVNCRPQSELSDRDIGVLRQLNASMISVSSDDLQCGYFGALVRKSKASPTKEKAILVIRPDRFVVDAFEPNINSDRLDWMPRAYRVQ